MNAWYNRGSGSFKTRNRRKLGESGAKTVPSGKGAGNVGFKGTPCIWMSVIWPLSPMNFIAEARQCISTPALSDPVHKAKRAQSMATFPAPMMI